MGILSAHKMVIKTQDSMKEISRDFPAIKVVSDCLSISGNDKLEEQDELDFEVEAALPQKMEKRKKIMTGERAQDESL